MNQSEFFELKQKESDIERQFDKKVYDFPDNDEAQQFYNTLCLQSIYSNIELNGNRVTIWL